MMQRKPHSLEPEQLIGTWQLIAAEAHSSTGEAFYPYGQAPVGLLMYDAKGYVAVVLMHPSRSPFASGDSLRGTPEELKTAFESFDAYAGTYTVDATQSIVTHHVLAARFPNWVGSQQVRYVTWTPDELQLRTPPIFARGTEWTIALIWKPAPESKSIGLG